MIDFESLNRQLLSQARQLIPEWVPGGHIRGREYVAGALSGGPGESLSINLESGRWADFASPDARGGDLVSLYAAIHGFDQRTAALALGATDIKTNGHGGHTPAPSVPRETSAASSARELPDQSTLTLTLPPPGIVWTAQDFKHRHHGLPSAFWLYRNREGQVLYAVARYDAPGGKQIVPWTHTGQRWVAKSAPKPRALYGLDRLSRLSGPTIIVEGEKTADAAQRYFPENPCLTWSGGANALPTADWSPLAGRACILWPDNDKPGRDAMANLASILFDLGCSLQIITAEHKPQGWDLADAEPEDDIPTYAESHIRDIPKPGSVPAPARVTRLQTTPEPQATTIHQPYAGSLDELYARHGFHRKSNGRPYANEHNVAQALKYYCATTQTEIYLDEFSGRVMVGKEEVSDGIILDFTAWMQSHLQLYEIGPKTVRDGLIFFARKHRRHPVKEWLQSLEWDSVPRLPDLLVAGFGTEPSEYHTRVSLCFLIGMVARVMTPGCKADCMPVFEGPEGARKSSALAVIGGKYFSEIHDSIMSKDFFVSMQGKMLCEISELHAFKTADVERIKQIISNPCDRYRPPYGASAIDHPRQGVFSGTTNRDDWNTSDNGARRFWPVRVGHIDLQWLRKHRDQLFAEALHRFEAGEDWWQVPEEAANAAREARQDADPWEEALMPTLRANDTVRIPYLLDSILNIRLQDMDLTAQRRVGRILQRCGYTKVTRRDAHGTTRAWVRTKPIG